MCCLDIGLPHTPSLAGYIYCVETVGYNLSGFMSFIQICTSPGDVKVTYLYFAILHNMYIVVCICAQGPYGLLHE